MTYTKRGKKVKISDFNVILNPTVPKDTIWFFNENDLKFRKPRKFPKYVFRLFGKLIRIFIEDL